MLGLGTRELIRIWPSHINYSFFKRICRTMQNISSFAIFIMMFCAHLPQQLDSSSYIYKIRYTLYYDETREPYTYLYTLI